ncbi:MAG: hypothetical protein AAB798_00335 [Patescibacteria group bacterium]
MEFLGKNKTVIIIVSGVLVAIGIWLGLRGDTPSDSLITTQASSNVSPEDRSLVDTLLQLRAVSLSGTIFSDPAFVSLRDFGTQIIPEPIGRANPFAPVSLNLIAAKAKSQDTQPFPPGQ